MLKKQILRFISQSSFFYLFFYALGSVFFFKKEVLTSKWFKNNYVGYIWLIKSIWFQRLLGFHRLSGYFVHPSTIVGKESNLIIHPDSIDALTSAGCYFQCFDAMIYLEENVLIAPNVGLITSNHDPSNFEQHLPGKDITIRRNSWIGMNSVILPGVELGEGTIVAAGSVVTKSFPQGHVLIAGVPAAVKKNLTPIAKSVDQNNE